MCTLYNTVQHPTKMPFSKKHLFLFVNTYIACLFQGND